MRSLPATLAASLVVLALGAIPAAASTTHVCKSVGAPTGLTGKVTATGITCTVARSVAKHFANTGVATKGWSCKAKAYEGGATISCHNRASTTKRLHFQIAD